ncbi:hypothetical protein JOF29_005743 [Kribbella aluminosa]|uniref:YhaN AAA domain-containing protein n=1 Tax=Kribbella aluminosa TaxID=416017 RepID=A0ABS4USM8_9ACTN|nr:AAA family ATPase [Kribbella aluminosa]MBP2354633.1 hypothetical protein [Kribbella aluminosa]
MRIVSVIAHAFGPLVDASLEFAPGITVLAGGNESAKSSWHAAVYSALCGRRRARGAPTREERRYADLHRPWDGTAWRVSAVVELDNGRRIELSQDLEGMVDCRAMDVALSRDVSAEIMFDGSPDGSRFVGLDRKSFAATACVNQAELLAVLDAAGGLQDYLARAAATAGTDATAAAALEHLSNFYRDHVGQDRANATKPLRTAKVRLASAEEALARARAEHADYLSRIEAADDGRDEASRAWAATVATEQDAHAVEELLTAARVATLAQTDAERARERATQVAGELSRLDRRRARATEIHSRFGGVAPSGIADQESSAQIVSRALAMWQAAPTPRPLAGPTAEELRAELETLPAAPDGDTTVVPTVRALVSAYEQATAVAAAYDRRRPASDGATDDPTLAAAIAAGPAILRELAASLAAIDAPGSVDVSDPSSLPAIERELDDARAQHRQAAEAAGAASHAADEIAAADRQAARVSAPGVAAQTAGDSKWRTALLAAAGVAALVGIALLVAGLPLPGGVAVAVAVLAGVLGIRRTTAPASARLTGPSPTSAAEQARQTAAAAEHALREADRRVAECEGRHSAAAAAARRAENIRADSAAQCAARGVPDDMTVLRQLAAQTEVLLEARIATARWIADVEQLRTDAGRAEDRLRTALSSRGVAAADDTGVPIADAFATYEQACAARAEKTTVAARRAPLEHALADRVAAEDAAAEAEATRAHAVNLLRDAARVAGLPADAEPTALAVALPAWQDQWAEQVQHAEGEQRDWAELVTLLEGCTLESLSESVTSLRTEYAALVRAAQDADAASREAIRERDVVAAGAEVDAETGGDCDAIAKLVQRAQEQVAVARSNASALAADADNAAGALAERARSLSSVPEAEEELTAAQAEMERVDKLAATLELTRRFLADAQEQVHRDIAPVLAGTLRQWLPSVTEDRYVDAMVDPATLQVKVRGASGRWRRADLLSVGTAEQVYLLLRVALAQHLTSGESCPLLLDDVTVQADEVRTRQLLELLLRLSDQRQVVLFAQEASVVAWAREYLAGDPRHALYELDRVATD